MAPAKNAQSGAESAPDPPSSTSAKDHSNEAFGTCLLDTLLALLIPGLILVHLVVAPYTKVEESFNIQAAHDVLVYGTPTSNIYHKLSTTYDHFTFPGAVPRTFIGPVLLAGFAQPIVALVGFQHAQFVVRAILGFFNTACLLFFARNFRRAYGAGAARWYLLLQASQFHVMFYASRTLPNMFAFGLTTLAFAFLLPNPPNPKSTARRQRLAIATLVFAAAIFRAEVALLLITTTLHQLLLPTLSWERAIPPFTISFLAALATSIPIDTYFWQHPRPIWPELSGFLYNVVHGAASDWGVSPWHWYFTSALPRLMLNPVSYAVLLPLALAPRHQLPGVRRAAARLVLPAVGFVAVYSLQPHKETRFVIYVVPSLTAAAALAASRVVFTRKGKGKKSALAGMLAAGLVVLSVLASFAASGAMLAVSALNYPGGEALAYLKETVLLSTTMAADGNSDVGGGGSTETVVVPVHADVLACMTGVTLFGSGTTADAAAAAVPPVPGLGGSLGGGSGAAGKAGKGGSETVVVRQRGGNGSGHGNGVRIVVDKTEDAALLASADFWGQFDYLLVEDPAKALGGAWETVGVVKGYAGIEVVRPGAEDGDGEEWEAPRVVGLGRTVGLWKRRVRDVTGGWWVGPRMVEKIYILKRVKGQDAARARVAVEAK